MSDMNIPGADPGFLDRGFKFTNLRGFDLLNLPDYLLIFQIFLKILHETEIILSQRGFARTPQPPLDPPLTLIPKNKRGSLVTRNMCQHTNIEVRSKNLEARSEKLEVIKKKWPYLSFIDFGPDRIYVEIF